MVVDALNLEAVTAGYGRQRVLHDVSLRIPHEQFAGLIGPNGCGKTTILRVISGILSPMSGRISIDGEDLRQIGRRRLARIMACLLQESRLDLPFTVREVVLMGRAPHLSAIQRETAKDNAIAHRAMELADVAHVADRAVTEISGGERQRAVIAMCLAQEPRILLLDEPTNHLDIAHQLSILDLIRGLNHRTGLTVIAVFHDLNLASEYCDQLFMLENGTMKAAGEPEAVLTADNIRGVYGAHVLVQPSPVSRKPHIVISAGSSSIDSTAPEQR